VEIHYYQNLAGERPFARWLEKLKEQRARARIQIRIARIALGILGDVRPVGQGVLEVRIDWGPGYRVYFAPLGPGMVLLLWAGDKRTQHRDIKRAKAYFEDYKARFRPEICRHGS